MSRAERKLLQASTVEPDLDHASAGRHSLRVTSSWRDLHPCPLSPKGHDSADKSSNNRTTTRPPRVRAAGIAGGWSTSSSRACSASPAASSSGPGASPGLRSADCSPSLRGSRGCSPAAGCSPACSAGSSSASRGRRSSPSWSPRSSRRSIGTQWGFSTLIWGLIEGLGAELVFALFLYANWRLWGALLAGAGAGVAVGLLDTSFTSYAALEFGFKLVYFFAAVVSGACSPGCCPGSPCAASPGPARSAGSPPAGRALRRSDRAHSRCSDSGRGCSCERPRLGLAARRKRSRPAVSDLELRDRAGGAGAAARRVRRGQVDPAAAASPACSAATTRASRTASCWSTGVPPAEARGRIGLVLQDPDSQVILARVGDDVAFGCENLGLAPRGDLATGRRRPRRGGPRPAARPPELSAVRRAEAAPRARRRARDASPACCCSTSRRRTSTRRASTRCGMPWLGRSRAGRRRSSSSSTACRCGWTSSTG